MTEYEAASLAISRAGLTASYIGLAIAAGNMLAAIVAAVGIWVFGLAMKRSNDQRAEAEKRRAEADQRRAEVEKDRHTESMEAERRRAEAEKDRHEESMEAERRRAEAEKNRHEESMAALKELIRRTSPPQPGPAE